MIHDTKLFEWIEDYCMENLSQQEKSEFETELKSNSELRTEVEFEQEIQSAITEKDIVNLREKIKIIEKQKRNGNTPFSLLDGFENIRQLTEILSPKELLNFYDSLPKAHVYQHELVSKEIIHEFYREQNIPGMESIILLDEVEDSGSWLDGLDDAILEKDVINLRDTLLKVTESFREQYSTEEIDCYLNGELIDNELERFEQELAVNNNLRREVKIHRELEKALLEMDVMLLRDELSHLVKTETSWNVSETQIEDYIEGILEGEELEKFHTELIENIGLKTELALRKNVDKAIGEKNVITLREKLLHVKKEVKINQMKSVIPGTKVQRMNHWWRAGVAVAVILFVFTGFFRNTDYTYNKYYHSPEWAPQRSVTSNRGILHQANGYFVSGDYEKALSLYDKAINENKNQTFVFQFYKAASLQNLEKYEEAIPEYSQVIKHGDNIFVEEAEWYKALCYLKLEKNDSAREHFLAIKNKNGYYANDAKAILRKTRFSFR